MREPHVVIWQTLLELICRKGLKLGGTEIIYFKYFFFIFTFLYVHRMQKPVSVTYTATQFWFKEKVNFIWAAMGWSRSSPVWFQYCFSLKAWALVLDWFSPGLGLGWTPFSPVVNFNWINPGSVASFITIYLPLQICNLCIYFLQTSFFALYSSKSLIWNWMYYYLYNIHHQAVTKLRLNQGYCKAKPNPYCM